MDLGMQEAIIDIMQLANDYIFLYGAFVVAMIFKVHHCSGSV